MNMSQRKPLLKIQKGDVYIQVPIDDPEAIELVERFLRFFQTLIEEGLSET